MFLSSDDVYARNPMFRSESSIFGVERGKMSNSNSATNNVFKLLVVVFGVYVQVSILVNLILANLISRLSQLFKVAESRPANLSESLLHDSSICLYKQGPVLKALDPSL